MKAAYFAIVFVFFFLQISTLFQDRLSAQDSDTEPAQSKVTPQIFEEMLSEVERDGILRMLKGTVTVMLGDQVRISTLDNDIGSYYLIASRHESVSQQKLPAYLMLKTTETRHVWDFWEKHFESPGEMVGILPERSMLLRTGGVFYALILEHYEYDSEMISQLHVFSLASDYAEYLGKIMLVDTHQNYSLEIDPSTNEDVLEFYPEEEYLYHKKVNGVIEGAPYSRIVLDVEARFAFGGVRQYYQEFYALDPDTLRLIHSERPRNAISAESAEEMLKETLSRYYSDSWKQTAATADGVRKRAQHFEREFGQLALLRLDFAPGHYNYACMLAILGKTAPALHHLQQAFELDGLYITKATRDPDLVSLRGMAKFIELTGQ